MVTPALKREFEREGVGLIPLRAGAEHFVREVQAPAIAAPEVLVGTGLASSVAQASLAPTTEPLQLDPETHLYLSDHKLAGKPVVPMAMMLEWFAAAATKAAPGRSLLAVEDLQMLQGIVLENGPVGVGIALTDAGDDRFTAELHDADGRVRARAVVRMGVREPAPAPSNGERSLGAYPFSVDEVYSRKLFHGDRFHAISEVQGISEGGFAAALRSAPERAEWIRGGRGRWTTDPLVVDGCFQSMILWCWEHRGSPSLPNRVDRFRQFRDRWPEGGVRARFAVHAGTSANVVCDIDLIDDDGALVARMEGVRHTVSASLASAFGGTDDRMPQA